MSGVTKKLMSASGGAGGGFTSIEDVFSTYLYTGNGSTQTITNGIDLAGEGGLVWIKGRSGASNHFLVDTERGANFDLNSNNNTAQGEITGFSFNSDGFTLGNTSANTSAETYASWTFRKAPRFFDVVTYTGNGVAGRTVSHNLGQDVGCIVVKRTDTTASWAVYHRGNTAAPETEVLFLSSTDATQDDVTRWNDTAPTDSVFTVGTNAAVNASGGTYVAYLFAHDPLGPSEDGSDGLIACGSYTGNGSTDGPEIDLGWEPQWCMIKRTDDVSDWRIFDSMRGWVAGGDDAILKANTSADEPGNTFNASRPTSTGFKLENVSGSVNGSGANYIYIAIRRGPMRAPESGTEVFAPAQYDGTKFPTGFPVDFAIAGNAAGTDKWYFQSRLQGLKVMSSHSTAGELGSSSAKFDIMDGYGTGFSTAYYSTAFRRAPEFFDVVAYTGDGVAGRTVSHNLGVAPEMMIIKRRDGTSTWPVFSKAVFDISASGRLLLNESSERQNSSALFNSTAPTESVFTLGTDVDGNNSGSTYIAYLFATLAGVSKVGSYTGNGTSQTINCGFTTGARFILIKRTDSTGDWYVWDTARGIVAANDPHLSLNSTAAEVTTDDSVDPDSSGFIVNQVAATNINVSAASYIFYAVA